MGHPLRREEKHTADKLISVYSLTCPLDRPGCCLSLLTQQFGGKTATCLILHTWGTSLGCGLCKLAVVLSPEAAGIPCPALVGLVLP